MSGIKLRPVATLSAKIGSRTQSSSTDRKYVSIVPTYITIISNIYVYIYSRYQNNVIDIKFT